MSIAGNKKHQQPNDTVSGAENVWIIDEAFYMPQLHRSRRIWLYLPYDYHTSSACYPVLYMQDGQNLFEEWSAYGEEWGVDESLNQLNGQCIVVGIDNGAAKRLNEYTLEDNPRYGPGEGAAYLEFLVNTLKPYIDKTYRTEPGRAHTFVAGSSMGGLISFYACICHPTVFGGAGIFSPAFWIASRLKDEMQDKIKGNRNYAQHFYFYYGEKESGELAESIEPVIDLLATEKQFTIHKEVNPDGVHSEAEWRAQFPLFYKWMIAIVAGYSETDSIQNDQAS